MQFFEISFLGDFEKEYTSLGNKKYPKMTVFYYTLGLTIQPLIVKVSKSETINTFISKLCFCDYKII